MNQRSTSPNSEPSLDLLIQRCADGELKQSDERELLARLDFHPEGWRQLALSFVENRVLGIVCRQRLGSGGVLSLSSAAPQRPARQSRVWPMCMAAALAILLGYAAGRTWPHSGDSTRNPVRLVNDLPGESARRAADGSGKTSAQPRRQPPMAAAEQERQPVMFVKLEIDGRDAALPVPVYSLPEGVDGWQPFAEPSITPSQADRLRRAGYQVNESRHLFQVPSSDGSSILLPLEAVDIRPARY